MRGFKDVLPPLSYQFNHVKNIFEALANQYGVDLIELPLVECAELYLRTAGEEAEICNKELFEVRKYKGEFKDWVLRPEGTASCMRALLESSFLGERKVHRLGYYTPMFRYNRPQKGRYRQFHQAGFEWTGIKNKLQDLELILSACSLLHGLSVPYSLEINTIGDIADRARYRQILAEYFEIKTDPLKMLDKLDSFVSIPQMEVNKEDCVDFEFVFKSLQDKQIDCVHNPYLVRGLDYYNGIVFEFKSQGLTVLAGGRYDGLMKQLGGEDLPAIGFGMGVDRVIDCLSPVCEEKFKVVLLNLNVDQYAFKILEKLRQACFQVVPLWGMDIKKGLKTASKIAKYVVIIGEEEMAQKVFSVRNLQSSTQKILKADCDFAEILSV